MFGSKSKSWKNWHGMSSSVASRISDTKRCTMCVTQIQGNVPGHVVLMSASASEGTGLQETGSSLRKDEKRHT